jgi:hypothetical protein
VPTAVAVVVGPEGADSKPRATAADGADVASVCLSSGRLRSCPWKVPISRAGNDGGAGMLPTAKEGATPAGGAARGANWRTFPVENAGASTDVGGAELTTTFGWYCGGGGIVEGCTACAIGCPCGKYP